MSDLIIGVMDALEFTLEHSEDPPFSDVFRRPLAQTDPNMAVGIDLEDWIAQESEIGSWEPLIGTYEFRIYSLVKHLDREEGRALHLTRTRNIRRLLARDKNLRVLLGSLSQSNLDTVERFQKLRVPRQVFRDGRDGKEHIFLSVTHLQIETETI